MIETDWTAAEAAARAVLHAHDGVAHVTAFLAAGLTRHQVAALFRRGALLRPRIGWYADPAVPQDGVRAVRVGGVLGCTSAARSYGLPVPEEAEEHLDVSVEDNASRLRHSRDRTWHVGAGDEADVRLHWLRRLRPVGGYRVSVVDALLQLAFCVPFDWLVAAVDAALRVPEQGAALLDRDGWLALRHALPDHLRRACLLADGRAESPIETLLRLALRRAGIACDIQVWVVPWYRVDILIDGWLVVEADGWGKYLQRDRAELDRERDAQLALWGYRTLRFTYRQIVDDVGWILEVVAAVRAERPFTDQDRTGPDRRVAAA